MSERKPDKVQRSSIFVESQLIFTTYCRAIDDDEEGFTPGEVKITDGNDSPLKIVQISAGDSHSVALGENGKAYYWGTFRYYKVVQLDVGRQFVNVCCCMTLFQG